MFFKTYLCTGVDAFLLKWIVLKILASILMSNNANPKVVYM